MLDALVFDCDGVLVDSEPIHLDCFRSVLRLRGIECNAPSRLAEAFFVRKILA